MRTDQLFWYVKNFDCNAQVIEDYNVLAGREKQIKKLKKKCTNRANFSEELKKEMMWQYWSRAEYELVIEMTDDNRIVIKPWIGCYDVEKAVVDVTADNSFNWKAFAEEQIDRQIFKTKAKIDVYDQLIHRWDDFVDYCWYTRLKYERFNRKFDRN